MLTSFSLECTKNASSFELGDDVTKIGMKNLGFEPEGGGVLQIGREQFADEMFRVIAAFSEAKLNDDLRGVKPTPIDQLRQGSSS